MPDMLLTNDFTIFQPVASKVDDVIAELTVEDDVIIKVLEGGELVLRLPALMGTVTTDATTAEGSLALGKDFAAPSYWSLDQVIAVYDATGGTYLTYNASAASSADLAAGEWGYDEATNTVFFKTAAVSSTVYVYALPFQYPVKVVAKIRQPGSTVSTVLWRGASTSFLVRNLAETPVTFTESVELRADDKLQILVTSRNQSKPFTPFLPDGSTPVKIFEISMDVIVKG